MNQTRFFSISEHQTSEEKIFIEMNRFSSRHAVRLHQRSKVWASIIFVFTRTIPNLFDTYVDPADVKIDIELCGTEPICSDHVFFVSKNYKTHPEFIKDNFPSVLFAIEHLLIGKNERETRFFLGEAIFPHLESGLDLEALTKMFIRVCPLIPIENRDETCKNIISNVTFQFAQLKCSKKLAPIFFEFALVLLNLHVIQAAPCAERLLQKNDFYPWKELSNRFVDLIRLCVSFDDFEVKKTFSDLDSLAKILRLIAERAKGLPILYRTTHSEALKAISRWTEPKSWSNHVFRMAETMMDLIDKRQINVELCVQFIEAIRAKIIANEKDEENNQQYSTEFSFYIVSRKLSMRSSSLMTDF